MKKLVLAAVAASSIAAAPAFADEAATTSADPFVSTQSAALLGLGGAGMGASLAIIAVTFAGLAVVASSGT